MDLKDLLKSAVAEMPFHEQEDLLKYLVAKMFNNVDLSQKVETVFNEMAEECAQEFLNQDGASLKIKQKVHELFESGLDNVIEDLFDDDDDVKEEIASALTEPVRQIVHDYFKSETVQDQVKAQVLNQLQSMVNDVEIDINF